MNASSAPRTIDFTEGRKRSVDNLQRLYSVVISLAVTEMLRRVLLANTSNTVPDLSKVALEQWLMLISFLFTVVPFYHGASRYLDATYITKERFAPRAALLIDFIFLFVEGVLFFVLAEFIGNQQAFYSTLAILLALDAIWVGLSTKLWSISPEDHEDPRSSSRTRYWPWAIVNVIALVAIWVSARTNIWLDGPTQSISLAGITVLRTILDYVLVFRFYYPPDYSEIKELRVIDNSRTQGA